MFNVPDDYCNVSTSYYYFDNNPIIGIGEQNGTARVFKRCCTQSINTAFSDLRTAIPNVQSDTKYVEYLIDILSKDDSILMSRAFKAEIIRICKDPRMTSTEQRGISSNRITDAYGIDVTHLECSICHDVLWQPVACQSCESPFCSACINQWLTDNPNNCPNRCEKYIERKCPPFIAKLLASLKITCRYESKGCTQINSYEALNKHEIECGYQPQQCPGCRLEILEKDFDNHTNNCTSIELTCQECKFVYKRGDTATKHTENICLREQLRQLRDDFKQNKCVVQELTDQLNEMRAWKNRTDQEVVIKFDDLPSAEQGVKVIPNRYRVLNWTGFSYGHELFWKKTYPISGYVTSFMPGGSPHIAYLSKESSISIEDSDETFSFISFTACAAWNDNMQLTVRGHRNSTEIDTHTITLLFGKPQLILLNWNDIDKVTFKPTGGTIHPGTGQSTGFHVIITQLTIGSHD